MQANYSGKGTTRPGKEGGANCGNMQRKKNMMDIFCFVLEDVGLYWCFFVVAFLCIFMGILPIARHNKKNKLKK